MKRILRMMMIFSIISSTVQISSQTPHPTWRVSEDGYYEISTAEELDYVRHLPESNFRLVRDIDLTEFLRDKESGWEPIDLMPLDDDFTGHFDGNNHTIRGLWIDRPEQENDGTGLFGHVRQWEIAKLTLEIDNRGITGFFSVGGLVGMLERGSVVDCGVKGGTVKGSGVVGGLVGYMVGTVIRSYSLSDVTGEAKVGGLIGEQSGRVSQSYAMGNVTGSMIVGGLVASQTHEEETVLRDSYATGKVMAVGEHPSHIGGLVGYQTIAVYNSYAAGEVLSSTWTGFMGGFAGDSQISGITDAFFRQEIGWNEDLEAIGYWRPEMRATSRMDETDNHPQGLTADQLMTASSFPESWHINEGGNQDNPWLIKERETYPYLWWQDSPYPQPPKQYPEVPVQYHTVDMKVTPDIELLHYTSGKLVVEDGGHLHLQFLPKDRSLTAKDILFLIDGVETPFKDLGGDLYYSYILNPIREAHSVLIALREYDVTVPKATQVQSDPVPGVYKVAYGEPFTLTLYPNENMPLQGIHVFANGVELEHETQARYALSLQYTIEQVTESVNITIKTDNNSVGNIDPTEDVQVYSINSELVIETTLPQVVQVYNITGALKASDFVNGRLVIPLSKGIYMVKTGDKIHKVLIK